jgi:type II secretory pathway pseudopilin PulG
MTTIAHRSACGRILRTRNALTLVEVMAGLVLAGTLLATVIIATGKHLKQIKHASEQQTATVVLEQFLSQWSLGGFQDVNFSRATRSVERLLSNSEIVITEIRMCGIPDSEVVKVEVLVGVDRNRRAWAEIVRSMDMDTGLEGGRR